MKSSSQQCRVWDVRLYTQSRCSCSGLTSSVGVCWADEMSSVVSQGWSGQAGCLCEKYYWYNTLWLSGLDRGLTQITQTWDLPIIFGLCVLTERKTRPAVSCALQHWFSSAVRTSTLLYLYYEKQKIIFPLQTQSKHFVHKCGHKLFMAVINTS